MDNVTIGFSRAKKRNIIGDAIMSAIGKDYSHVYIKFYSYTIDRYVVYHADDSMVHFRSFDSFKDKNEVVKEYDIFADREAKMKGFIYCVDMSGVDYGTRQLLGMALARVAKSVAVWLAEMLKRTLKIVTKNKVIRNPLADGKKSQVCSELTGGYLNIIFPGCIEKSRLESGDGPEYIEEVLESLVLKNSAKVVTK